MAIYKLKDICLKIGSGATPKGGKEAYCDEGISLIRSQNVLDFTFSYDGLAHINDQQAEKLSNVEVKPQDILLNITGDSVARVCTVDPRALPARVNQHVAIIRPDENRVLSSYILYFLQMIKPYLLQIAAGGATRNALTKSMIENLELEVPDILSQKKIVSVLDDIQGKIRDNNEINKNLEQQAFTIFNNMFPNVSTGNNLIGDLITPQRGKNLLSKDAIPGKIPVVAGGLEPATYHNQSNTVPPVLTISSSGANAGFVNLWNIPVWSSDSSFIDSDMTDDVYFWYVMLKIRQQEIFDAQTEYVGADSETGYRFLFI